MTDKQKRFCDEYLQDFNATQAAIRAGYSKRTAQEQSSRLLSNVMVQEYIREQQDKMHRDKIASAEEIQEFLSRVMRGELEEIVVSSSGKAVEVPAGLKDRLKAADMLSKANGTYETRLNIKGDIPVVIEGYDDIQD